MLIIVMSWNNYHKKNGHSESRSGSQGNIRTGLASDRVEDRGLGEGGGSGWEGGGWYVERGIGGGLYMGVST